MELFFFITEIYVVFLLIIIFLGALWIRIVYRKHNVYSDPNFSPSITVLMSCFNEGEAVFHTIKSVLNSKYKGEIYIIAVDDCSKDDSLQWMLRAAENCDNVRIIKNEVNLGKPRSLLKALKLADTELILNIDSDGILDPYAISEVAGCFVDSTVGACGGNILVNNSQCNLLTQLQTLQYTTTFNLGKIAESYSGSVNCISGALFAIRRSLYVDMIPEIEDRKWGGLEVKDGEDRFMTNQVTIRGFKTIQNIKARVFTNVPEEFNQFFSQQIRWRRGAIRLFFWSLKSNIFSKIANKITPLSLFKFYSMNIIILIWPFFILWCLITMGIYGFIIFKLYLIIFSIIISSIGYFSARATDKTLYISFPAFIVAPMWIIIDMFFITILSLFTLTSVSWETRQ